MHKWNLTRFSACSCIQMLNDHLTCCTGVYFTVCVLSWLLMISKSLTASALAGPLKLQSKLAFPAPLVLTVKWVGLFSSTPEGEERWDRERGLPQGDSRSSLHMLAWRKLIILFLMHSQLYLSILEIYCPTHLVLPERLSPGPSALTLLAS